jgi:hypothetical protein
MYASCTIAFIISDKAKKHKKKITDKKYFFVFFAGGIFVVFIM